MNRLSKCVFAAFACLLLGFSATLCPAQNEGPLLYAGLLGYTGGIEDKALLLSPATIGHVYSGQLKPGSGRPVADMDSLGFNLRLGTLSVSDDNYPGGAFIGISLQKNVHEYISLRGSLDYGEITHEADSYYDGGVYWQTDSYDDESLASLKISLLIHPAQSERSGYFNPYLGLGAEFDYFNSQTAFGVHILAGVEYVFDSISIGIEASYSSVGDTGTTYAWDGPPGPHEEDVNPSNFAILLNVGFRF